MWEKYQATAASCTVCQRSFDIQFRYQVRDEGRETHFFCSQVCHQEALRGPSGAQCTVCAQRFSVDYPYQIEARDDGVRYFCSVSCREQSTALKQEPARTSTRIAVFNHKGGTGKTTTAVNLAAGFAETGMKTLLVDADGQGNVGASLGIRGEYTLYHILVQGRSLEDVAIPVRNHLDVVTSNELLAVAELHLASRPNRDRVMRERLSAATSAYDTVVVDCAPALSLMNQNALMYADSVVVPVSCDYLSLVGVKQVLKTIKNVRELLKHDVALFGVLPTFYDVRNKICREAVDTLTDYFGDRCLPPIRVNTKLREAPSVRQTIFEYAADSHGALDYRCLVERLMRGDSGADAEPTEELGLAQVPVTSAHNTSTLVA